MNDRGQKLKPYGTRPLKDQATEDQDINEHQEPSLRGVSVR